jgi:hypothetical protein
MRHVTPIILRISVIQHGSVIVCEERYAKVITVW